MQQNDLGTFNSPVTHTHKAPVLLDWFGWFGILFWMYMMINDYLAYSHYSKTDIFWSVLAFMVVFSVSILLFGFRFGRDPNGIGKIAIYTTPIAIMLTGTFSFLPEPFHAVAYSVSAFFIAPALIRSVYGVVKNARPNYTMTTYMVGLATAYFLVYPFQRFEDYHLHVLNTDPPSELLFAVYAVFLIPSWIAASRRVTAFSSPNQTAESEQNTVGSGISKNLIFGIIAAIVILAWLRQMCDYTNYAIEQYDDILYTPLYEIMPFVTYVMLGIIADKKLEKHVITIGFAIYLIAIMIAMLVENPGIDRDPAVIPILFMNRFVNLTVEYIAYTIPVYFFKFTKRPVFAASAGLAAYLFCRTGSWTIRHALPDIFGSAGETLFISSAIAAVVFYLVINIIFDRHKEKTIAAALSAALLSSHIGSTQDYTEVTRQQTMLDTGLTREEAMIARLIIDGETRRSIERKLHMTSAELNQHEQSIKKKITPAGDPDPHISRVISEYKLTKRETEILKFLRDGVTTNAIAEELVIAEETVRSHVRSLLKKLGLESRGDVAAWIESDKQK